MIHVGVGQYSRERPSREFVPGEQWEPLRSCKSPEKSFCTVGPEELIGSDRVTYTVDVHGVIGIAVIQFLHLIIAHFSVRG